MPLVLTTRDGAILSYLSVLIAIGLWLIVLELNDQSLPTSWIWGVTLLAGATTCAVTFVQGKHWGAWLAGLGAWAVAAIGQSIVLFGEFLFGGDGSSTIFLLSDLLPNLRDRSLVGALWWVGSMVVLYLIAHDDHVGARFGRVKVAVKVPSKAAKVPSKK